MYEITTLYTLNLHHVICQLYLNKAGKNAPKTPKCHRNVSFNMYYPVYVQNALDIKGKYFGLKK